MSAIAKISVWSDSKIKFFKLIHTDFAYLLLMTVNEYQW